MILEKILEKEPIYYPMSGMSPFALNGQSSGRNDTVQRYYFEKICTLAFRKSNHL